MAYKDGKSLMIMPRIEVKVYEKHVKNMFLNNAGTKLNYMDLI